ncbi:MAG: glycosyltransferase [Planctomycetota bacterium]
MPLLEDLLTGAQLAILVPLVVLGLHRGWMIVLCLRGRAPQDDAALPADLPFVTVQLPIYNERHVARRIIEAALALDWPRDRLEIQVLDDSTDDTREVARRTLDQAPDGLATAHLSRADRVHYKAGALQAGLQQARGELIAVFDADFVPPADFLRRLAPAFEDPQVGLVQARWEHLNAHQSLLTRMQALLLDGHFAVEHVARAWTGRFFNFNGTAGVFRRTCIENAGGWQGDTLTEDLDLSYRAQLRGWRFVYRPDVACPAELPSDINAFLNQQHRWAKGAVQTARKLLGKIWRAPLPLATRTEATFHLLGNVAFPLLLGLIVVALPLQALRLLNHSAIPAWLAWLEGLPLLLSTLCVLAYYGLAETRVARWRWSSVFRLPLILAIGAGLCVNNTLALVDGLRRTTGEFRRTPKLDSRQPQPAPLRSYRPARGPRGAMEVGLGLWALSTWGLATVLGLPFTAAFHGLFACGLLSVGSASLSAEVTSRIRIDRRPALQHGLSR